MFHSERSCWDYAEPRCPTFDTDANLFWSIVILIVLFFCFDVNYYARIWWDSIVTRICRRASTPPILSTHVYKGTNFTNVMDFSRNLNNPAGFLRECHFALQAFLHSSYLYSSAQNMGIKIFNASNNIKLRKSISFFQSYSIYTRIVWWDDQSLYLEQKLIRKEDQAVCAINYSRQTLVGCSPQKLLDKLPVCSCKPELPPEIASWMVCIKVVNRELHHTGQCN